MTSETKDLTMQQLRDVIDAAAPLGLRSLEDAKKLSAHLRRVIDHPLTQLSPKIQKYLVSLNEHNRKKFLQNREEVEVVYVYPSETKNNQQRQRFNSLSVAEVSDLLKIEFANAEKSVKVHICTECNVEIETNDEEPLMESLQKHFNLEVHQPKKLEPSEVSEPIVLPNLSRRKSAMVDRGEAIAPPAALEHLEQIMKENLSVSVEKPDKLFSSKLETFLVRNLPDNSEASLNAAVNFYQGLYERLCSEISTLDYTSLSNLVAPIIMSIKDNVDQHVAVEIKRDEENNKNQVKKQRYYAPIENAICRFLTNHKLLTLVDDRTAKLAFFCMSCEYYTLRFRYDSVLNHVFSDTHVHNLSNILESDDRITFALKDKSIESIKEMNRGFLCSQGILFNNDGISCGLCKSTLESNDEAVMHLLDENHLGRMSDRIYQNVRGNNGVPEDMGQKSPDWTKHLSNTGRVNVARDTVIVENFIKPSGKVANHCPSCDMILKGPRQVLFNHVRQKKHLRNVAPEKLKYLFKNHCRPLEYFASFGKYYQCVICPDAEAIPSFSMVVEHVESDRHVESIALLIKTALHYDDGCVDTLKRNGISDLKCDLCDLKLAGAKEAVVHALSSWRHGHLLADGKRRADKKDVIGAYMKGDYILFSQTAAFTCAPCGGVFASVRSLLMHLVYADHFQHRMTTENVFRFYLELKHNIGLIIRNKYARTEFGALFCGACECYIDAADNAKRHTTLQAHRERVAGATSNEQPQGELE